MCFVIFLCDFFFEDIKIDWFSVVVLVRLNVDISLVLMTIFEIHVFSQRRFIISLICSEEILNS